MSKIAALAHERDPQAAFSLLIVRMVLKIAAAAKLLAAAAYGMVTGLGLKYMLLVRCQRNTIF